MKTGRGNLRLAFGRGFVRRALLPAAMIIGQKVAQPSARFLSSAGVRLISTTPMNLSTHPKQRLVKEAPATEVPSHQIVTAAAQLCRL